MGLSRHALALLAVATALAGCLNVSPAGTAFASDPPGARVQVDGKDSGWVTPCLIALNVAKEHHVTISLAGYELRDVVLEPDTRRSIVSWYQGLNGMRSTTRFPMLLPTRDLLQQMRRVTTLA